MTSLFVTKLVVEGADRPAYALFLVHADDGSVADAIPSDPIDDAVALATIAKKYAGTPLSCGLDLASIGAPLGYVPMAAPSGTAAHRGAAALKILGAGYADVDTESCLELGHACAQFVQREPWKRSTSAQRFAARVQLRDERGTHALSMVVRIMETDDGPGIEITDDGAYEKMLREGTQARRAARPMRLALWATTPPRCFDAVLMEAFGASVAPRVVFMLEGTLGPHGELEAAILAAVVRAVAAGPGSSRGEARVGEAVISAEIDRSRVLAYRPPPRDSRLEHRESARAVAQARARDAAARDACVRRPARGGRGLVRSPRGDGAGRPFSSVRCPHAARALCSGHG